MYLGTVTKPQKMHSTRWVQGIGDLPYVVGVVDREYQRFECDHCGRVVDCLSLDGSLPSEPFFCRCQRLISIASPLSRSA